jgi:HK97 family phage major capsid protein
MTDTAATPEATPEGGKLKDRSAIQTIVNEIVAQEKQEWMEGMTSDLGALLKPDRGKVPEIQNRNGEPVIRLVSPTEHLYDRMTPEERKWRDPESDHHMAEELRALATGDRARLFAAHSALAAKFGRTNTLEGTPGASGALATGTGGSLISRPLEAVVLIARDKVSKMPRFASSFTMTKQTHTVPTAGSMTTYQTSEGGTTTQGEPEYSAVQLSAVKTGARGVVSLEQLEDSDVNVVTVMTTRAGMAIGAAQEAQYWRTGDGTAPNISAFAAGTTYTPSATATALDFTSVSDAYYTLPQVYRENSAWYAASNVLGLMNIVRDGNGRAFYQGLGDGPRPLTDDSTAVGTLMGRPVYEVDATAGTIHFGDLSQLYIIGSRAGITARMSEHAQFAAGLVEFIWEQRYDGNNVDTSACQTITGITSANSL